MESGVPLCSTCGKQAGLDSNGEVFFACHECNLPICKSCFDYEIKDGRSSCFRCGAPYQGIPSIRFQSLYMGIGLNHIVNGYLIHCPKSAVFLDIWVPFKVSNFPFFSYISANWRQNLYVVEN